MFFFFILAIILATYSAASFFSRLHNAIHNHTEFNGTIHMMLFSASIAYTIGYLCQ